MQEAAAKFSDFIKKDSRLNSLNCSPEKFKETIKEILREWDQKRLFDLQTSLEQKSAFCKLLLNFFPNPEDVVAKLLSTMSLLLEYMSQNCTVLPVTNVSELLALKRNVTNSMHALIEETENFSSGDHLQICNALKKCYEDTIYLSDLFQYGDGDGSQIDGTVEEIYRLFVLNRK